MQRQDLWLSFGILEAIEEFASDYMEYTIFAGLEMIPREETLELEGEEMDYMPFIALIILFLLPGKPLQEPGTYG